MRHKRLNLHNRVIHRSLPGLQILPGLVDKFRTYYVDINDLFEPMVLFREWY